MTVDATGLTIPTQAEIFASMDASLRASIGPQIQTGPDSALGQIMGVVSALIATAYEALAILNDANNPDFASGAQLDAAAALSPGITRDPAQPATAVLTITGTPTTPIPAGSTYRVTGGALFDTVAPVVIGGGGTVDADLVSQVSGAITAAPDTITEEVDIIAGVDSVTNAAAAVPGAAIESDEIFRQRREESIQLAGAGTDGAIAAALGELDTVQQVLVISNRTTVTDSFGIPAHGVRPVLWPAQVDSQPAWQAIFDAQPSGIQTDGAIAGTATDPEGLPQAVAYELAGAIDVWIEIVLTKIETDYAGDAAIKAAVEAFVASPRIGADLLLHEVEASITEQVGAGILTLDAFAKVGGTPGGGDDTNIPVASDEIMQVDPANITVVSS
jgi:uncharacterized phage protein gp47/JayE